MWLSRVALHEMVHTLHLHHVAQAVEALALRSKAEGLLRERRVPIAEVSSLRGKWDAGHLTHSGFRLGFAELRQLTGEGLPRRRS